MAGRHSGIPVKKTGINPEKGTVHHYPSLGYDNELSCTKLGSLVDWRVQLCRRYIFKISQNRNPIHFLAPKDDTRTVSRYNLRTAFTRKVVYGDRSSAAHNAQVLLYHLSKMITILTCKY